MSQSHIGLNTWTKGRHWKLSEETKIKISNSKKGQRHHHSPETIEKIRSANTGKKRTLETKKLLSRAATGRILSNETRRKIGNASRGRKGSGGGPRIPLSEEHKRKISKSLKGRKPSNWSGEELGDCVRCGEKLKYRRTKIHHGCMNGKWSSVFKNSCSDKVKIRASKKYQRWRSSVFKRDNYTCVLCGARNGFGDGIVLAADHIIPFAKILDQIRFQYGIDGLYKNAMQSDLLFNTNNGRTLCTNCHKKTETFGRPSKKNLG